MPERKFLMHWPVLILGVVVAFIFCAILFVFKVQETEYAVLKRFGKSKTEIAPDGAERVRIYDAGLRFKLPFIEEVWRHDKRLHCYDLKTGKTEETPTADDYQIIVTTFVLWKVGDGAEAYTFLNALGTTELAETNLDELVRNSRNNVIGRHRLDEFVNVDESAVKIRDIEAEILADIRPLATKEYGIDIRHIGFRHVGFPESVTTAVFDRMREERKRLVEQYRSQGESDAAKIRAGADEDAARILAQAKAEATRIRAEGDKVAAESYAVFSQQPKLAAFLRKLEALRETMSDNKTTLIIDTNTPPYDLFLPGATDFGADAASDK